MGIEKFGCAERTSDTTFSTDGQAFIALPPRSDFSSVRYEFVDQATAVQKDGKVLVAGVAYDPAVDTVVYSALIRINADGTPDQTYIQSERGRGVWDSDSSDVKVNIP